MRTVGTVNDRFVVYDRTTNVKIGDTIVFTKSTIPSKVHFSFDGTIMMIVLGDTKLINVYNLINNEWIRYGQVLEVFDLGDIILNGSGKAFFIYNINEIYNIDDSLSGVGILYIYDEFTSQWVEVYRYRGSNGSYVNMNDLYTIITVKRAPDKTDYIKIRNITRTVENYDDIVVKSIENTVNTGSNVYGVGYQALTTSIIDSILFNTNTSYTTNNAQNLTKDIISVRLSDNGLVLLIQKSTFMKVYKRNSDTRLFELYPLIGGVNILFGTETFIKMYISTTGKYFAVVTQSGTDYNTRVYEITSDTVFVEIFRTPSLPFNVSTVETNILFSDDETVISIYDTTVRTYSLSPPNDLLTEFDESTFGFPILAVSKDLNRFVKYDTDTGIIKIFNADGTPSGLKLNRENVRAITISKKW